MKRTWLYLMMVLTVFTSTALGAPEPLDVALGAQAGMQDVSGKPVWIFGPIAEFGPRDGLQVRLGAELGVIGEASITQLETLVFLNLTLGARIYFGGGVAVAWVAGAADPSHMQIPLLVLAGLKTRPIGPWTFSVEGLLLVPADLQGGFTTRFSAGLLFAL
ncbi:MAG: hypothetical protein A2Z21_06330 [Candidatus Fraserbacteria bacterium RBG_16_55_9]|uniref:Outer membrane protein beta-barrel domain-containing protein n=1 Tax=Fraserbacteria sp. (strain RBG_16_55_9) TaxID=1817864 RepID=A0A1F5UZV1_FRAXR|nr:MAG: hypothetical protein A2Z21_06330 [Candidatus Fraserbacteria bacterium RBG_16_55_9]